MNLHVQPELGALRLYDVHVSTMDGSDTARGRLSILLDLIRDKHCLFSGGRQACLPGKFGNEVPYAVMPACVKTFSATRGMSAVGIKDVAGGFDRTAVLPQGLGILIVG